MKKTSFLIICLIFLFCIVVFSFLFTKKYTNEDFGIVTYRSEVDMDNDGVDDQTDFLNSVKSYIKTKPKYKSKYYATGYSNDEYGVCTDVVAFGLLNTGYDLMTLVDKDIRLNLELYDINVIDKNIDFRRVKNLIVYFERNAISLTTDISKIEQWQGGDIVVFPSHIGVLSDKRNRKGIPYVIHHANFYQFRYEEDILSNYEIVGHYRIS